MNYYDKVVQEDLKLLVNEKIDFAIFKNKKILVTGANGMLATYFVYFLMYLNDKEDMNVKIYALSRNEKKLKQNFLYDNRKKDVVILIQDVCNEIKISDNIDYIIHMASSANPFSIVKDPIGIIKANLIGTFNVLDLAKEKKSEVIFTSTREIYGKMPEDKKYITETDMGCLDCFETRACYPESKRMAENILLNYYKQYGVKFKNLRIAHTYGPGMNINNDGRIMADLIYDIVNKKDIVLKSNGEAKRAFCYITDAISAILYIMANGNAGEVYNIANETEEIKIKDLAKLMINLYSDYNINIKYEIENNSDMYTNFKRVGLDTTKIENLGWKPKILLQDGIRRTVEFSQREKRKIDVK